MNSSSVEKRVLTNSSWSLKSGHGTCAPVLYLHLQYAIDVDRNSFRREASGLLYWFQETGSHSSLACQVNMACPIKGVAAPYSLVMSMSFILPLSCLTHQPDAAPVLHTGVPSVLGGTISLNSSLEPCQFLFGNIFEICILCLLVSVKVTAIVSMALLYFPERPAYSDGGNGPWGGQSLGRGGNSAGMWSHRLHSPNLPFPPGN